ncbi:peptidoglycan-binding protein [Streptomyces sp. NPDC059578]|uniref:peptidoglycan-binding domain-containing protein n=1 Tax=unclassified Streptomyces TaxID=2593676 RepID=UPI0036585EB6
MNFSSTRLRTAASAIAALTAAVIGMSATPASAATGGTYTGLPFINGGGHYRDDWSDEGILSVNPYAGHARSNATCLWQRILHLHGLLELREVDGIFGQKTANATKQFQQLMWLSADGAVGKDTFNKAGAGAFRDYGITYVSGDYNTNGAIVQLRYQGDSTNSFPMVRTGSGHYLFPDRNGVMRAASYDYLTCS